MTNEEMLGVADIVERATNRFNAQAALHRERFDEHVKLIASMNADHDAKLVEHRAAFNVRTEADAKIIAGLRVQVQDQRAEIERLKAQTPKQHPAKVAAWVRRTDEGYPDAPTGYMAQVLSVTYRVRDQSGSVVFWYSSFCEPCDPPQTEPVPKRAHPVTKGEYVKVSNGAVTQVLEVHKDWYLVSGGHGWTFANCSPYDPPEATHDTEAGKAAAEAALKTEPVAEEIKVGDLVEVKQ